MKEFKSGAKRSELKAKYGYMPGYSLQLTALRFEHGHTKYDPSELYSEANWLRAVKARDVDFIKQCFFHGIDHLWSEMRGEDDPDIGGNLGALGWMLEVLAYTRATDPELYNAARGLVELEKSATTDSKS